MIGIEQFLYPLQLQDDHARSRWFKRSTWHEHNSRDLNHDAVEGNQHFIGTIGAGWGLLHS